MAITTAVADSFIKELLSMTPHTAGDTYKCLLLKVGASGTYGAATTNVGTPGTGAPTSSNVGTDECAATGNYVSGGATLSGFSVTGTTTARLDFTSPTWSSSTISAIGAVIYNSTRSGAVLGCFDFGGTITSTNGTFTATMPAVADGTSLIRIA